jgi:hypothetical protein
VAGRFYGKKLKQMKNFTLNLTMLLFCAGFSISSFAQSAGASCSNATYDLSSGCTGYQVINDETAESSIPALSCPSGSASFESDGWYTYTVPAGPPQNVTIIATSSFGTNDLVIQVFSGTCASLTEVDCTNDIPTQSMNQTEGVTINGLLPGTYFVRFSNWGSTVNMHLSDACVTAVTGIDENSPGLAFNIYPNPATSTLQLKFDHELKDAVVELKDVLGQQIITTKFEGPELSLDLAFLAKGVYFISVLENGSSSSKKIILD